MKTLIVYAHPSHRDSRVNQALLTDHQRIVLQHPLYWFSCPALLKEWLDSVLARGWAYGRGGDALTELLRLFEMTAHLCGLHYLASFVTHGSRAIDSEALAEQARAYRDYLLALWADPASYRLDSREACR